LQDGVVGGEETGKPVSGKTLTKKKRAPVRHTSDLGVERGKEGRANQSMEGSFGQLEEKNRSGGEGKGMSLFFGEKGRRFTSKLPSFTITTFTGEKRWAGGKGGASSGCLYASWGEKKRGGGERICIVRNRCSHRDTVKMSKNCQDPTGSQVGKKRKKGGCRYGTS